MIDAHGIGGQADLPIPLSLAVSGAVAALVVSFTVLIQAWRKPRYDGDAAPAGRPLPALSAVVTSPSFRIGLRVLGFAVFAFAVFTAVLGEDALTNPFFGIVYVWWWVGVAFTSLLLGPVWRAISPVRTVNDLLALVSGGDPSRGIADYPRWLGQWPAALGLFAFVWLELVYHYPTDLGPVRLWCAAYFGIMLIGGAVFGSAFYENADPFEVFSSLLGKLSPWAMTDDGLVLRSPLANLATVPAKPGLVAVVAVLFGSTAFDSFSESSWWVRTVQGAEVSRYTLDNSAILAFCVGAGVLFSVGCMATGVGPDQPRRLLPRKLAHSIVPILAGYVVAHYLTLFVDTGVQTLGYAADPLGKGWNLLGLAAIEPTYWFSYHPTLLATIKVVAVVIGHVTAAVAAHDRAISLLPKAHQVTGQLPLLITMVGFTAGGLYLLFSS